MISFFSIKGGIGKTTTTLLTAYELSKSNPDNKILLIDTDMQANLTQLLYSSTNNFKTIINILLDESLTANDLIIKSPNTNYKNIDLIPADINLSVLNDILSKKTNKDFFFGEWFIKNQDILNNYDYIFVDLAPSYSITSQNFLLLADTIISPVLYGDITSINGAIMLKQILIHDINRIGLNKLINIRNVITKKQNGNKQIFHIFKNHIREHDALYFLETEIQDTTLVQKALLAKLSLSDYSTCYKQKNKYIDNFNILLIELQKLGIL